MKPPAVSWAGSTGAFPPDSMHPAFSIVLFTTLSGAGYGLLFTIGLTAPAGLVAENRWLGLVVMAIGMALVAAGLIASTFHLKHPERAWRALTQWRSSWLSREGVMALLTFVPALVFAAGWVLFEDVNGVWAIAGALMALGALITVICTAMIYRSLKTVRYWYNTWTMPTFLTAWPGDRKPDPAGNPIRCRARVGRRAQLQDHHPDCRPVGRHGETSGLARALCHGTGKQQRDGDRSGKFRQGPSPRSRPYLAQLRAARDGIPDCTQTCGQATPYRRRRRLP